MIEKLERLWENGTSRNVRKPFLFSLKFSRYWKTGVKVLVRTFLVSSEAKIVHIMMAHLLAKSSIPCENQLVKSSWLFQYKGFFWTLGLSTFQDIFRKTIQISEKIFSHFSLNLFSKNRHFWKGKNARTQTSTPEKNNRLEQTEGKLFKFYF